MKVTAWFLKLKKDYERLRLEYEKARVNWMNKGITDVQFGEIGKAYRRAAVALADAVLEQEGKE